MNDFFKENRRSGRERRIENITVLSERRQGIEQRDLIRRQHVFINKLKNTPLFHGLSDDQFMSILAVSAKKVISKGNVIYHEGAKLDEMLILIDGVLQVTQAGKEVNLITPIGFSGAIEIITGEPCSVSLLAKSECTLLRINKVELVKIFDSDSDLYVKLLTGILIDVSASVKLMREIIVKMKDKFKHSI